jgi:hypothetical protein
MVGRGLPSLKPRDVANPQEAHLSRFAERIRPTAIPVVLPPSSLGTSKFAQERSLQFVFACP